MALVAHLEGVQPEASRVLAELEGKVTPEAFAEAVERGRKMTLGDVMAELTASFSGSEPVEGSG